MNRPILAILLFLLSQASALAEVYRYRVYLDGKPDSKPVMLTPRAQERRQRLSIEEDEADLSVSESYIQQLREAGLTIMSRSRWLNTAVVILNDGERIEDGLWQKLSFVKKVEVLTMPQNAKSAPRRSPKRELEETQFLASSENCTTPLREVKAYDALYKAGHRGKDVMIAVFDGGFLRLNECTWLKEKVVFAHDLYHPTDSMGVYVGDNHGIQCMSIMACPEKYSVCGTAQDATYCLFNTENGDFESSIEEDMWVAAAEMCDSLGVNVISSSLGYCDFDNDLLTHTHEELAKNTASISRGAKIASQKGILVVNSSGNYGNKAWEKILFPADTQEVLAVGAYTPTLEAADFTSRGFLSPYVKPDVAARGQYCYAIIPTEKGFAARSKASGTSFSTPLVAGLCASLWSAVPELSPEELRQVVNESASNYDSPDILTGYGLPDFSVALEKAREMKGYSSIEQITIEAADEGSAASEKSKGCYNLMGQPILTRPSKGTYIKDGKLISVF